MLQTFTLANGIKVVTYHLPSLKSVNLRISVKGGAIVEEKNVYGVAHFMEHMLVQGIPSFPDAQALSYFIESLAGHYNAYTSQLTVSFGIGVPYLHAEDAVRIASQVFFSPLFPESALEKERRAVLNEIKQDMDSRWYKFNEFFKSVRFTPDSPLHIRTGGSIDTVQKITHQDLLRYWKNIFVPKNTYIFMIGNLEKMDMRGILDKYFSKIQGKEVFPHYPKLSAKDFTPRQVAIRHDTELQVNYLDITFPSLSLTDDMMVRIKQNIALIILGRLRTSRLFQLLRYKKGLVYGVSASDYQWPGVGYVEFSSEVAQEHLHEVIELMTIEIQKFKEQGPTQEELDFTKHYLSNSWLMAFDNPSSIADWISGEFLWRKKIVLPEEYSKVLDNVTRESLVDVMQEYWNMDKVLLTVQGPVEDNEKNRKVFSQLLATLR